MAAIKNLCAQKPGLSQLSRIFSYEYRFPTSQRMNAPPVCSDAANTPTALTPAF